MKFRHALLSGIDLVIVYGLVYALGPYSHGWGDALLHVLAGGFLVIVWLWFRERFLAGEFEGVNFFFLTLAAVLVGSLMWEGFEVVLRRVYPLLASALGFNSPENDSLSDVAFALLGGAVTYAFLARFSIINKKSL